MEELIDSENRKSYFDVCEIISATNRLNDENLNSMMWNKWLTSASNSGASDIQFIPTVNGLIVRFKVMGEMTKYFEKLCGRDEVSGYVNFLKEISNMDTSTKEIVQDGAFDFEGLKTRYRVALKPTVFGESLTMRVIEKDNFPQLESLKLSDEFIKLFIDSLAMRQGLILVTGPTGSGKSTLLQAGLGSIDTDRRNLLTLEEPVERLIPGAVQAEIGKKLTWEEGIKTAMREAPDVILIGEIRDSESARLSLEAAKTGHLVLSTLHTNSTAETFDRLETLGVSKSEIESNVLLVTAQRLVQILCPVCRKKEDGGFSRGSGCERCENNPLKGIAGRAGVFEYRANFWADRIPPHQS